MTGVISVWSGPWKDYDYLNLLKSFKKIFNYFTDYLQYSAKKRYGFCTFEEIFRH